MTGAMLPSSEFALLLVQEWLVTCKLESTVHCLVNECARTERDIPSPMVWNRMVENLGFGSRNSSTGGKHGDGNTTLIEEMIRRSVHQHEKDVAQMRSNQALTPQQQVVVMSKKRELRFVTKRSLPRSRLGTSNDNAHDHSSELSRSASALRPKSAMVCKSTSNLISNTFRNESLKNRDEAFTLPSNADYLNHRTLNAVRKNQRPISAASVLVAHKKSIGMSRAPSSSSPISNALQGVTEAAVAVAVDAPTSSTHRNSSAVGLRASLPHLTGVAGALTGVDEENAKGDTKLTQRVPTLSLEEMSEERLTETFGSISHCAIKKLRRVLAKSNACSQEFDKSQRTLDKIKARAKLHQLRRVLAEEKTPLLSSTMASLTSEPCSLCQYVFPKINLTTKVSFKSIVDLRASWSTANRSASATEAIGSTEEGMNHARMTHLYDEAPVCAFCSQLVLNYSSYRPSSAERRAQHVKERRDAMKSLKENEAKERQQLERCDPLDFHSYELNSEDDGSDVEEVVEVETDGRPQVVRRLRRQTRTPVQLGVVSKRLHYDTLRSDSLHMLTLNEWQKIIR